MGEAAVGLAGDIEGLVLEDGEVLKLDRDGKEILKELVESYKAATGAVAPRMIADKIDEEAREGMDLPQSLEDQF